MREFTCLSYEFTHLTRVHPPAETPTSRCRRTPSSSTRARTGWRRWPGRSTRHGSSRTCTWGCIRGCVTTTALRRWHSGWSWCHTCTGRATPRPTSALPSPCLPLLLPGPSSPGLSRRGLRSRRWWRREDMEDMPTGTAVAAGPRLPRC